MSGSLSMSYTEQLKEQSDSITGILSKVQDDLRHLRENLDTQISSDSVDLSSLQTALSLIESTIVERTEAVLKARYCKFTTLPFAIPSSDSTTSNRSVKHQHHHRAKSLPPLPNFISGSPGQEAQLQYISKLLSQPTHPATRQVLSDAFGIPCTTGRERRDKRRVVGKGNLASGSTIQNTIPRKRNIVSPPLISSRDAQKGILNLVERGLIPKSADIILNPSPVQPHTLRLNKFSKSDLKIPPMDNTKGGGLWTGIKFDYRNYSRIPLPSIPTTESTHSKKSNAKLEPSPDATLTIQNVDLNPEVTDKLEEEREEETVSDMLSSKSGQCKIIVRGGFRLENEEYLSYKEKNKPLEWSMIDRIIDLIEEMAQNYAIPVIFISADKALLLGEDYDLEPRPSNKELLKCILNSRDVAHLLTSPGRRYKGIGGLQAAVSKVQATYRMYVERRKYLSYRRMKWASGVIAMGWSLYMKARTMKAKLREIGDMQIYNYRMRLNELGKEWSTFNNEKRVIVHVPSKGYPYHIRKGTLQFPLSQNLQLPRIFDAIDPNIELIYVLPVELGHDVLDYYKQLLISARGHKDGLEAWDRIHFITPEYSPLALKQIRNIIGSYKAVLIPHVPYQEDMAVADYLNIPVLGCDPGSVRLYSSFAGRRLLFNSAKVKAPPYVAGIRTNDQFVESLTWLVINYPLIRRWLFKLDYYCHGQGIAYCDVGDHLDCHQWIIKEKKRYGDDKWKRQWAQETARQRVQRQLHDIIHTKSIPYDTSKHPTWSKFLNEFLSYGGSIEGCPPSDSVTSLTTDLLLAPDQSYSVLCTWDHILSDLFTVWGGSIPQSSVDNDQLVAITDSIAQASLARGLVGHISVDYVTFIDPDTMSQVVWAVDIDFGPSDILYMNRLRHSMIVSKEWSPSNERRGGGQQHYAVASTQLCHPNLSLVEYSVFFQMCKAHLIGFNDKTYTGTLFALIEGIRKHNLAMICIQPSLKEALISACHTLSVIHQEVSSSYSDHDNTSELSKVSDVINKIINQLSL